MFALLPLRPGVDTRHCAAHGLVLHTALCRTVLCRRMALSNMALCHTASHYRSRCAAELLRGVRCTWYILQIMQYIVNILYLYIYIYIHMYIYVIAMPSPCHHSHHDVVATQLYSCSGSRRHAESAAPVQPWHGTRPVEGEGLRQGQGQVRLGAVAPDGLCCFALFAPHGLVPLCAVVRHSLVLHGLVPLCFALLCRKAFFCTPHVWDSTAEVRQQRCENIAEVLWY